MANINPQSTNSTNAAPRESKRLACDGGGGNLGHPRVFLSPDKEGHAECPYCGRHFTRAGSTGSDH